MRALVLIITLFSTGMIEAQEYRTEFYKKFPFWESPIQPVKFSTPLTEVEAIKTTHVKVSYDEFNRISRIEVRQGNEYKELGHAWGALYVHAVRTDLEYKDNQVIHRFYNRYGHRISGWGDVWEKVYTYDPERFQYTSMTFTDKSGNAIENSWGIARYDWQHQPDGSVIESRVNLKGEIKTHRPGFQFKKIRMVFAENGHLRVMQNLDENNHLLNSESGAAQYNYYYESNGKFQRWEVYDDKGNPAIGPTGTAGEYYVHKLNGYLRITFFDMEGELTAHASGSTHWEQVRDKYGNLTERRFYDADLKLVNGRYGYAVLKQTWDTTGMRVMKKELFDANRKLTTHIDGYSQIIYTYDRKNLLTKMEYQDAKGTAVNNAYTKFSRTEYIYNKEGMLLKQTNYDLDGNEV